MEIKINIFIVICVLLILFTAQVVAGDPPGMILLIMDQTGLKILRDTPTKNIDILQEIGAFGLMNVRTAGDLKPESTYLTAGNGKKCKGSKYTHKGKNNGNNVVNQYIDKIKSINKNTTYRPEIGLLGKVCRENNKKIAVFGNADTVNKQRRTVVSLAMDENGNVDMGDVSNNILKKTDLPWGYCTDWSKIKNKIIEVYDKADLIVIETGDMSRIEQFSEQFTEKELSVYKSKSIKRIDEFISYLTANINLNRTLLGIAALSPPADNINKGKKLTWLLLAGKGIKRGWLTSETTRRKGIITITDILPAIFSALEIHNTARQTLNGHIIKTIKSETNWLDLFELNRKITSISNLRKPFVQGFIGLQLFVIILAIICIFYKKLYSLVIIQYIIEYLLVALFLAPLNFLIISLFNFYNPYYYLLLIIIISVLEIYIVSKINANSLKKILIISTSLLIVIIIDLINYNYLMADSLLGYSSIIGARYYGLGNEYMGLFIGAGIISVSGIIELIKPMKNIKYYKFISALIFTVIIYFTGASHLGANFGGTITATFACAVTWLYIWGYRINIKTILFIILLLIFVVLGIIYLDYNQVISSRTHIGRAVKPIITGDYQQILDIILRKIRMNIKLMKWTIWTRVLLAFLIYIIIMFKHPVGNLKNLLSRYQLLAAGFYGGVTGSIITLMVNDSGVVASATLLFYPMLILLYLFHHINRKQNKFSCQ